MNWIKARLGETSTHIGIGVILSAVGAYLTGKADATTMLIAVLGALAAIGQKKTK